MRAYRKWQNVPLIIRLGLTAVIVLPITAKDTFDVYFGDNGLSETELEQLREVRDQAADDPQTVKHKQEMFRQCQRDRSITGLGGGVPDREQWRPREIIPGNRFAEGAGLFEHEEEEPEEKPIYPMLDVILVAPNLDNPRLTWVFGRKAFPAQSTPLWPMSGLRSTGK